MELDILPEGFKAKDIKEGDLLFIGKTLTGYSDQKLAVDTEGCDDFFRIAEKNAVLYINSPKSGAKKVFEELQQKTEIGEIGFENFCNLMAFTLTKKHCYSDASKYESERNGIYREGKVVKLSRLFKEEACACSEYAALAQLFLQKRGMNSSFIDGAFCDHYDKDAESYGEDHSFIMFEHGKNVYVFDPANPICYEDALYPFVGKLPANKESMQAFEEKIKNSKEEVYFEVRDMLSGNIRVYGYARGGNIYDTQIKLRFGDNNKDAIKVNVLKNVVCATR